MTSGLRAAVASRPVLSFFVLTYLISWSAWGLILLGTGDALSTPLFIISQFGPFLAALVVARLTGTGIKSWFVRIFNWRAPAKWYLLALALPIFIMGLSTLLMIAVSIEIDIGEVWGKLPGYLPTLLMVTLLAGIGEEPGWRGLALPRLQRRYSPVVATTILGLVWAMWHFPLIFVDEEFASMGISDPLLLTGVLLTTMFQIASLAFLYTWIYNNTRSVALMMLFHGSVTTAISIFLPMSEEASHGSSYPLVLLAITCVILVTDVLLVVATKGRLGYKGPEAGTA